MKARNLPSTTHESAPRSYITLSVQSQSLKTRKSSKVENFQDLFHACRARSGPKRICTHTFLRLSAHALCAHTRRHTLRWISFLFLRGRRTKVPYVCFRRVFYTVNDTIGASHYSAKTVLNLKVSVKLKRNKIYLFFEYFRSKQKRDFWSKP